MQTHASGAFDNHVTLIFDLLIFLAVWRSGSIVRHMNEVALRWARLVLGWVTVFGRVYHLGM